MSVVAGNMFHSGQRMKKTHLVLLYGNQELKNHFAISHRKAQILVREILEKDREVWKEIYFILCEPLKYNNCNPMLEWNFTFQTFFHYLWFLGSDPSIYYDVKSPWPSVVSGSKSPDPNTVTVTEIGWDRDFSFIRNLDWAMTLKSKPHCRFSWKWFRVIIIWLEWFFMAASITFPSNLWQTRKAYPSYEAGATKYFPHKPKKPFFFKEREKDQFVKPLQFSLNPSKLLYSTYPAIMYCGKLLNPKQICHLKIKMLSSGDFTTPSKENRSGHVLSNFFSDFCLFVYPVFSKSKSWVIIALLLNTWEHTGLYGIFCSETRSLLPLESRDHSWTGPRTFVSCGRNVDSRLLVKKIKTEIPFLFTVTPPLIKNFILRIT